MSVNFRESRWDVKGISFSMDFLRQIRFAELLGQPLSQSPLVSLLAPFLPTLPSHLWRCNLCCRTMMAVRPTWRPRPRGLAGRSFRRAPSRLIQRGAAAGGAASAQWTRRRSARYLPAYDKDTELSWKVVNTPGLEVDEERPNDTVLLLKEHIATDSLSQPPLSGARKQQLC